MGHPHAGLRHLFAALAAVAALVAGTSTAAAQTLSVTPSSHNFMSVEVDTVSTVQTFRLENTGGPALDIVGVVFNGAGCAEFASLDMPLGATTLNNGEFVDIDVTFEPMDRGMESCDLRIDSNDGGTAGTITDVPMTGNGIAPELAVSTTVLAFSPQRIGAGAAQLQFDIENNGELALTVDDVSGLAAPFSSSPTWPPAMPTDADIAPGGNITITVDFDPSSMGSFNDTITITSADDPVDDTETVSVSGLGTEAQIAAPAAVDFNDVVVDDMADRAITITNDGNVALSVTMTALSGGEAADFTILGPSTPFLVTANGGTRNINVRCQPAAVDLRQTTLEITSTADATPLATVDLDCTGVKPDISVDPATAIDFMQVEIPGSSSPVTFDVSNANLATTSDLTFDIAITGLDASAFTATSPNDCIDPQNCVLAPGQSETISVVYTPSAASIQTATLVVTSDDQEDPVISFGLQGEGTQPEMTLVSPGGGSHDFGDVPVMMPSSAVSITVRNDGSAPLDISQRQLGGASPGEFNLVSGPSAPLTLGLTEEATWEVDCEPSDIGLRSATFEITSNSATGPDPRVISLDCNGIESRLAVNPSPISFGDVRIGESLEVSVQLTNEGNIDLQISDLMLSHADFAFSTTSPPPAQPFTLVADGGTETFGIVFTPMTNQAYSEILTIETDTETRMTAMSGFGRLAQLSMDPVTHNFGDIDVCTGSVQQTFTIENTGDADWEFVSVALDNLGDFSLGGISPAPGSTIPPTGTVQFTVTADPDAVGAASGTVTVTTDIPGNPTSLATVSTTGVSGDISLSTSAVDYGTHDVQATAPATRMVTLTNDGDADLEVTGATVTGPDAAAYTVTGPALPATIPPAPADNTLDVLIDYQPSVESAGDDATLEITSDAGCGATSMISLSGRGIDRHIAVDPAMTIPFGEQYRFADEPIVQTLEISNTGEAPLDLSIQPLPADSPFSIPDTTPMLVMPQSAQTVDVEFLPTGTSPSADDPFTQDLTIVNDDSDRPMVVVTLEGVGVQRRVTVSPGVVDLGTTGVNVPIVLSTEIESAFEIINNDVAAFRIREIQVEVEDQDGNPMPGDFYRVVGFTPMQELPADDRVRLDIEFVATEPGQFTGTVLVFLDGDPEPIDSITLTARAVDIQLRGGGCAATGDGGRGTAAVVGLVLVLVLLGRRRLGRAAALLALAGAVVVAGAGQARAQDRNLELRTFQPPPAVEAEWLGVEGTAVGKANAWALGLSLYYAMNPLHVEARPDPDLDMDFSGMEDKPVSGRFVTELAFAYAIAGRFEAAVTVPLFSQSGDAPLFSGLEPADGIAFGDVGVHGKVHLWDGGAMALATSAAVTLPTSSDGEFAGIDKPSGHLRAILGIDTTRVVGAVNAGARIRGTGMLGDIEQGSELTYGFAAGVRVVPELTVIGELFGAFGLTADETTGVSPLEWTLGARYRVARQVSVAAGAGRGLLPGIGAPDFRGFLLVTVSPKAREVEPFPIDPGDLPAPVDRGDDDGDGIINSEDECPNEPEDADDWDDTDGCPDPDNDGDGIPDDVDPCPLEAEDKDGFKDGDGCDDTDNDEDEIPDADDQCPDEPEDPDGFEDDDGCDDPDNDHDGIPDVVDQCALEAETINGHKDDDGCPDPGDSLVMVTADRIEVFEPVRFRGNSAAIQRRSHNVLGQVAATLRANRQFLRIRIAVHVHPRGSKADDQALTKRRAEAVRQWLTEWGIEPERLDVQGYGSQRLLVPRNQRGARQLNDRVEFVILEKKIRK